jgi:hypothetical protein
MVAPYTTRQQPAPHETCVLALLESQGLIADDYAGHLSAVERVRYLELISRQRRLKWLSGRLAAKYLFLSRFELGHQKVTGSNPVLLKLSGETLDTFPAWMYRKVEILPRSSTNASPRLFWCGEQRNESISLSHAEGVSCACLAFAGPTSVDIENAVQRVDAFYRKTFTDAEQSWVSRISEKDKFRSDWLFTFLWTLKESALKLQTNKTLWDLPRIEIHDLPEPKNFSPPRSDRNFVNDFLTFPVSVRDRQFMNQVQVAVTGSRNLILTVMKPLSGVIN